jgi:hypothetical protein
MYYKENVSKEIRLQADVCNAMYTRISHHQNAGQYHL